MGSVPAPDAGATAAAACGSPAAPVTDPRTRKAYVLIRSDLYRRGRRRTRGSMDDLDETYSAQIESAMRAGWNDPRMRDYDEYDAHRTT